jgi:hypothetical protein
LKRGALAPLQVLMMSASRIVRAFRRQKMVFGLLVALALLALSIFFAFLAAAPVLSPFVYPLF